jgi:formate dehydrogenase major subunit
LISLALLTGNVGRPGTGLHPLRGQNNVPGASDVGLIPFVYTDYQSVSDPAIRAKFERAWGMALDLTPGLTVVESMHQVHEGHIKGIGLECSPCGSCFCIGMEIKSTARHREDA